MFVKVCGVRTEADIIAAAAAGADAVGLVFGESVRRVDVALARRLVETVPPHMLAVGVFGGIVVRGGHPASGASRCRRGAATRPLPPVGVRTPR